MFRDKQETVEGKLKAYSEKWKSVKKKIKMESWILTFRIF